MLAILPPTKKYVTINEFEIHPLDYVTVNAYPKPVTVQVDYITQDALHYELDGRPCFMRLSSMFGILKVESPQSRKIGFVSYNPDLC